MAGATIDQSFSFGPFSNTSYPFKLQQQQQQQLQQHQQTQSYADFSPPLYSPVVEDFGTDFTTDSAPSPRSPVSPLFGNYQLPAGDDWVSWDKVDQSPEPEIFFKSEPFESPALSAIPPRSVPLSPAVNPMELANPLPDDVTFGREGINDTQPLFQSPQVVMGASRAAPVQPTPASPAVIKASRSVSPDSRRYPARTLKRKSSSSGSSTPSSPRSSVSPPPLQRRSTGSSGREVGMPPKKTAHNMIEKRYRTNLNDKIAALRDSVPALRVMVHRVEHSHSSGDEDDVMGVHVVGDDEDLGGLTPAHKLNKATILSKATEYIAHLERRNHNLAKENSALRSRVEGFEMLVMSRGGSRGVWN